MGIDVTADFDGSGSKADVDVNVKAASVRITCPGETIAEDDSQVTFPDAVNDGDCLGDGIRSDSKDPSKYIINKNGDGTLTYKSDGYPDLKMTKKALMAKADNLIAVLQRARDFCSLICGIAHPSLGGG